MVARVDDFDRDVKDSCDGDNERSVVWRLSPIFPLSVPVPAALGIGQSLVSPSSSPELTLTLLLLNERVRLLSVQTEADEYMPASFCEELEAWRSDFYEEQMQACVKAADIVRLAKAAAQNTNGPRPSRRKQAMAEEISEGEAEEDLADAISRAKNAEKQLNTKTKGLTKATNRVQALETELSIVKGRAESAEAAQASLSAQVSQLQATVQELKILLKNPRQTSTDSPSQKHAEPELSLSEPKTGKTQTEKRKQEHTSWPGHYPACSVLDTLSLQLEQRKRRRREQALQQQQMHMDDLRDDLLAAQLAGIHRL